VFVCIIRIEGATQQPRTFFGVGGVCIEGGPCQKSLLELHPT